MNGFAGLGDDLDSKKARLWLVSVSVACDQKQLFEMHLFSLPDSSLNQALDPRIFVEIHLWGFENSVGKY